MHVEEAREERCITWNRAMWGRHGCPLSAIRRIETPPTGGCTSTPAVMHEIGHCQGRYQAELNRWMTREFSVWEWAGRNALLWTPQMERPAQAVLNWYRHRVKTALTGAKRLDRMKVRCRVERSITQCRES